MSALTENFHAEGFIVSEAPGTRSRDKVTIASGNASLKAGSVLGQITVGAGSSAVFAGNTGNGVMGAITVSAGAKAGDYKLVIIEPGADAGKFEVEGPDGILIGTGTVAVAFSKAGIAFTLADGATDFVSGDGFTITVAAGSLKWNLMDPAAADGSQIAAAILLADCDATSADQVAAALTRDAEVNAAELVWKAGTTTNQKTTAKAQLLATQRIVSR